MTAEPLPVEAGQEQSTQFPVGMPMPPSARLLGWRLLSHDAAANRVRIAFDGHRRFCNPAGLMQGGLAAMLDETMGPAVWLASGGQAYGATIDMNVSCLSPARPGPLHASGHVLRMGRSIAFVEAELRNTDDCLLARATASMRLQAHRRR